MNELTTLHEAITATIKAAMPQLETVAGYATTEQNTALPALNHAMVSFRPGTDPGDGRCCILATFEADIHVDASVMQAPLQAASLATQLTVLLRQQFWQLDFVQAANNVQASVVQPGAGTTFPTTWRVQWEQALLLGAVQWPWPDQTGPLAFAFSPDTGPRFEADYQSPEDLQ
ncbi:hypothetical protein EXN22_07605 [Pseudomonas tructae]|uniref:Phage protein n=1 Tax=Pseudomonas tructae TaxID=2518644 RepID=A0A411MFK8_9PSED|nr:hypothetical protein [Pseudomonas tructae]QBF25571.1 hypothetical protein EXN22_07605 [Pseudomonas tructae]